MPVPFEIVRRRVIFVVVVVVVVFIINIDRKVQLYIPFRGENYFPTRNRAKQKAIQTENDDDEDKRSTLSPISQRLVEILRQNRQEDDSLFRLRLFAQLWVRI